MNGAMSDQPHTGSDEEDSEEEEVNDEDYACTQKYLEFVPTNGVERLVGDPYIFEIVFNDWTGLPSGILGFEYGGLWNYVTNADDSGNHDENQRLPPGYHLTADIPDDFTIGMGMEIPVVLHYDAHDPVKGPFSTIAHLAEIIRHDEQLSNPNLLIDDKYDDWEGCD